MASLLVGIDLGGTHFQVGVVKECGEMVGRASGFTNPEDGVDAVIDRLAGGVRDACRAASIGLREIHGIGVGTPAPIDRTFSIAIRAVNLDWYNVPLARLLSERLEDCRVTLDNDVNAAVWGEYILGAGRGHESMFGMWVGTGIGGGLILEGRLHHGAFGTAGEVGLTVFNPNAQPPEWVYENHASRKAIIAEITAAILEGHDLVGIDSEPIRRSEATLRIADVAAAYRAGDERAQLVIQKSARASGIMAANVVTLLSLDAIILGGGVAETFGDTYVALMREWFDRAVFPDTCKACDIIVTHLRENAGLLGAAMLARDRFADS